MLNKLTFHRSNLAAAYCDSLSGQGIANATSGLFLAGPRRVGKTTFLMQDLLPEADARQWLVVYVDLWSNKCADPAILIIESVKAVIAQHKSRLAKLAKKIHLKKVDILKSIELDFSKPGLPEHVTLTNLFNVLVELSNKPVLLVVDEAQHALTSEQGINAMFAIKSARDQLNCLGQVPQLMLVLTGSNRDKLAQLVIKKEQPFFGSDITAFPLLGKPYTDFFTKTINHSLAADNQFLPDTMWEVFQLIGYRPEILRQLAGNAAISHDAGSFSESLQRDASLWHGQIWNEFEYDYKQLPVLHRAILSQLIEQQRAWSPFSEQAMQSYCKLTGKSDLSSSSVQTAIQVLREKGFIWQSSRGAYALEDDSFAEWFMHTGQVDLLHDEVF
ncbi:MAG: ATP-binding protein [Coxiellaceae bacterium]|nr:ATP-binding protein [Coxiellaceae bacterium]